MKKCKCEHWQTCPVCYPQGFDEAGNRKPVEIPPTRGEMLARIKELEADRDALAIVIQKMRDGITTCLTYKATPSSELLKIGYDTTTIIKRHDADKKDAERYRWLRATCDDYSRSDVFNRWEEEDLDAAIDAEIGAQL